MMDAAAFLIVAVVVKTTIVGDDALQFGFVRQCRKYSNFTPAC
jgi:hypothetical protein